MAQWLQCWMPDSGGRLSFGFHNPNHAAALACAFLPLCWGWRRAAWGEDDTRRVMPREAIDPELLNPLFNARIADLWWRDAP